MNKFKIALFFSVVLLAAVAFFLFRESAKDASDGSYDDPSLVGADAGDETPPDAVGDESERRKTNNAAPADDQIDVSPSADGIEGPTLSGTVLGESASPLAGATVSLLRESSVGSIFERSRRGDRSALQSMLLERQGGERDPMRRKALKSRVIARVMTANDGSYAFAIASLPRGEYRVLAQFEGFAGDSESWAWAPKSTVLDFRLGSGTFINGIVLDKNGAPISLASVYAVTERSSSGRGPFGRGGFGGFGRGGSSGSSGRAQAFTDDTGRFTLHVASGTYRLSAEKELFRPESVSPVETGTEDVVLKLENASVLLGKVVDESGRPVVGAALELHESGRDFGRGRGGSDRGRSDRGRSGRGRDGDDEGRGGESRADDFEIGFRNWVSTPEAATSSDKSGEFRFDDVSVEDFSVIAQRPGYVAARATGEIDEEDESSRSVTVTMRRAAVISGTVKSSDGKPVAGAFVSIGEDRGDFGRGGSGRGRRGSDRGRGRDRGDSDEEDEEEEIRPVEPLSFFGVKAVDSTDRSGRFAVDTLPPGEYVLTVESDLHPVFRVDKLVVEDKKSLEVELEDGLAMRGTVVSARGGKPVAGAEVRFSFSRSNRRMVQADENGVFEVSGFVDPNVDEIRITASGFTESYYSDVDIGSSKEEFEIEPAAVVAGHVVDGGGRAVAKARVSLALAVAVDEGGEFDFRQVFQEMSRRSSGVTTDIEGAFSISEVAGGESYNVTVDHPEYERLFVEAVEVGAGDVVENLKLVVRTGARIEVVVRSADGLPLRQASVRVQRQSPAEASTEERGAEGGQSREAGRREGEGDDERRERMRRFFVERVTQGDRNANRSGSKRSGPDGRAVFAGMEPGLYRVQVEAREHQKGYFEVTAVEDTTVPVAAQLLAERFIAGRVIDPAGEAIRGARVRAYRETSDPLALSSGDDGGFGRFFGRGGGSERDTREDRAENDGSFRLGRLTAVPYTLRVSARGYNELRLEGITPDREMDLTLEPLGSISGRVVSLESGLPVPSFRIRAEEERPTRTSEGAAAAGTEGRGRGSSAGRGGDTARGGGEDRGGRTGRGEGGSSAFGGRDRGGDRGRGRGGWRNIDDAEGLFEIDDLEAGTYEVEVAAEGYTGTSVRVKVRSGEATAGLVISLEEGIAVVGVVVRQGTNEPLPGAVVYLLAQKEEPAVVGSRGESGRQEGERRVGERSGDRGGRRRERGDTRRTRRGSPEEEAKAAIAALGGGGIGSGGQQVESDGSFKLLEVPEGRYLLVVDHESFVPLAREIVVIDGRFEEHSLALAPGESLTGTVKIDRDAAEGYDVVVESADGFSRRGRTDAKGRYSVTGLLPGNYALSIRRDGESLVRGRSVDLKEGRRNEFDLNHESDEN